MKKEKNYSQRVYFIKDDNAIKIGISYDVNERLRVVQTGNPRLLKLLGSISGSKQLEDELHVRFIHLRIRGEWYRADKKLLDYISEVVMADTNESLESARQKMEGMVK